MISFADQLTIINVSCAGRPTVKDIDIVECGLAHTVGVGTVGM